MSKTNPFLPKLLLVTVFHQSSKNPKTERSKAGKPKEAENQIEIEKWYLGGGAVKNRRGRLQQENRHNKKAGAG